MGMHFSFQTFMAILINGWVVDGRSGGLVIGRSHDDGNIYFVTESPDNKFVISGHVEGDKYILNYSATEVHESRLLEMNEFYDEQYDYKNKNISSSTRVINTHAEPYDKFIWIDSKRTMIVNKYATAKYFDELEEINDLNNAFKRCEFNLLDIKENT